MQIGTIGAPVSSIPVTRPASAEAVERGPDRDNDGDEGGTPPVLAAPGPGRGGAVDLLA